MDKDTPNQIFHNNLLIWYVSIIYHNLNLLKQMKLFLEVFLNIPFFAFGEQYKHLLTKGRGLYYHYHGLLFGKIQLVHDCL